MLLTGIVIAQVLSKSFDLFSTFRGKLIRIVKLGLVDIFAV